MQQIATILIVESAHQPDRMASAWPDTWSGGGAAWCLRSLAPMSPADCATRATTGNFQMLLLALLVRAFLLSLLIPLPVIGSMFLSAWLAP